MNVEMWENRGKRAMNQSNSCVK